MNKVKHIFAICLVFAFLCSCQGNRQAGVLPEGDTLTLQYAQLLTIVDYNGYSIATIGDPWNKGRTLHEYVLLPKDAEVPSDLAKATIIRTPVSNALIYTAVHSALAIELGAGKDLKGDLVLVQLDYARVTVTHQREVGVFNALRADGDHVTDN